VEGVAGVRDGEGAVGSARTQVKSSHPDDERAGVLARTAQARPRHSGDEDKPAQYYDNIYYDREGMFRHTPYFLEQQLVQYVVGGNEDAALETLNSINRRGDKAVLARDPLRSAKNSLICSCTFLTRAAIRAGVSDAEAFALSDAAIQHIETLSRREDVFAYEQTLLLQTIRLVNEHRGRTYTAPIRKALYYVNSHLDRSLSLAEIAKFVRVHPNYLSKRFRQETGTTLSHYIVACKIHEATYFVRHSEYSMAEIAALYGFSSQSYFISSFKKIQGMSPGKYRSMHASP
jgi:AraC-like DNA-binding protein